MRPGRSARRQEGSGDAVELADVFCQQARRRVEEKFEAVWSNDDVATYAVARKVLDGGYTWLEQGMVGTRGT